MEAPFAVVDDGTGVGGLVAAVGAILLAVALMRCLYALAMCNAMERNFIAFVEAFCITINILHTLWLVLLLATTVMFYA